MMESFPLKQSLPLCCSLAALGGLLEVGATAVTAVPAVRDTQGKPMNPWLYWASLAGNVLLQVTGSIFSHLIATWFGPVGIVVPFFYSATLLSNMLIFGFVLGLEFFTKTMRVGTYVIVVAVILLPVVGPTIQEHQNIMELFSHWYACAWFGALLAAMSMTAILLCTSDITTRYSKPTRTIILLVARATSITVNLTVSRAFIMGPSHWLFLAFICLKLISGGIYTYAIVVQSTAVEQATFVPLNTTTIIVINALTGIIIWQDYKVVTSWYGYACVFVLLGLGADLLLSVPLLNDDNPQFGLSSRATILLPQMSSKRFHHGDYYPPISNIESVAEEDSPLLPISEQHTSMKQKTTNHPVGLSKRDAWFQVLTGVSQHPRTIINNILHTVTSQSASAKHGNNRFTTDTTTTTTLGQDQSLTLTSNPIGTLGSHMIKTTTNLAQQVKHAIQKPAKGLVFGPFQGNSPDE